MLSCAATPWARCGDTLSLGSSGRAACAERCPREDLSASLLGASSWVRSAALWTDESKFLPAWGSLSRNLLLHPADGPQASGLLLLCLGWVWWLWCYRMRSLMVLEAVL